MTAWTDAPLVALDLEGSGAQDHENEAILEIAIVPITSGRLSLTDSYATLINPRRAIPLHRHCLQIQPAALIDTLRLARHIHPGTKGNSLTALLDHYQLTTAVSELTPSSQPHRALWDTIGAALLLTELVSELPDGPTLSLDDLKHIAGYPPSNDRRRDARGSQLSLLET
jgi:DNA polymerase-3 subunit epsilon/exodeoxyribonuclease X